jgi:hypothetical protein
LVMLLEPGTRTTASGGWGSGSTSIQSGMTPPFQDGLWGPLPHMSRMIDVYEPP